MASNSTTHHLAAIGPRQCPGCRVHCQRAVHVCIQPARRSQVPQAKGASMLVFIPFYCVIGTIAVASEESRLCRETRATARAVRAPCAEHDIRSWQHSLHCGAAHLCSLPLQWSAEHCVIECEIKCLLCDSIATGALLRLRQLGRLSAVHRHAGTTQRDRARLRLRG